LRKDIKTEERGKTPKAKKEWGNWQKKEK